MTEEAINTTPVVSARVLYDFAGDADDELALTCGSIISIKEQYDVGWSLGEYEGKTGLFPTNYVEVILHGTPEQCQQQQEQQQQQPEEQQPQKQPPQEQRQPQQPPQEQGQPQQQQQQQKVQEQEHERQQQQQQQQQQKARPVPKKRLSAAGECTKPPEGAPVEKPVAPRRHSTSPKQHSEKPVPVKRRSASGKENAGATSVSHANLPKIYEPKSMSEEADQFIREEQPDKTDTGYGHQKPDERHCAVKKEEMQTLDEMDETEHPSGFPAQKSATYENVALPGKAVKLSSRVLRSQDVIRVHFMVTTHSSKSHITGTERVFIYFGHHEMGNFQHPFIELVKEQKLNGSFALWTGYIIVPKSYVRAPVPYKYVVMRDTGVKYWEYLYYGININCNRLLYVYRDETMPTFDTFFQVDDCILPKYNVKLATSFIKGVKSEYDWTLKMTEFCLSKSEEILQLFLNKVPIHDVFANMLFMVGVVRGFSDSFVQTVAPNRILHVSKLPKDGKFNEILLSHAIAIMKEEEKENQTINEQIQRILKVMTIAVLMKNQQVNTQFLNIFCKSLSMESIPFKDNPKPLNEALSHLPGESLAMFEDALKYFWMKGFTRQTAEYAVSIWYPLVIIHVISGKCLLFRDPTEMLYTHVSLENCGLPVEVNNINEIKIQFLNKLFGNLKEIRKSLHMDKLLQRSVLFFMEVKQYQKVLDSGYFDQILFLQMVAFQMAHKKASTQHFSAVEKVFLSFQGIVETNNNAKTRYAILESLLRIITSITNKYEINSDTGNYFHTILGSLNLCILSCMESKITEETEEILRSIKKLIPDLYTEIDRCLRRSGKWPMLSSATIIMIVQIAENFYSLLISGLITAEDDHKRKIIAFLYEKLNELAGDTTKFLEVYGSVDPGKFPPKIQTVFENICTETLDNIAKDTTSWTLVSRVWFGKNFTILSNYFSKEWDKQKTTIACVRHCVSWAPMKSFMEMFVKMMDKVNGNNIDASMNQAYTLMKRVANDIVKGCVTVEIIDLLEKRKEAFFDVIAVLYPADGGKNVRTRFEALSSQLLALRLGVDVLEYFLEMGKVLPERACKLGKLRHVVEKDVSSCAMDEIFHGKHGLLEYFGISPDLWNIAQSLNALKMGESLLFKTFLELNARKAVSLFEDIDQDSLVDAVLQPALVQTKSFFTAIINGGAQRSEIVDKFRSKSSKDLLEEFSMLRDYFQASFSEVEMKECISRIEVVLEFENCLNISNKIKAIAETLNLKGDFQQVFTINQLILHAGDVSLKDMDQNLIHDVTQMSKTSPQVSQVISYIEESLKLFQWLRRNLHGRQEVWREVEMMSIAAGENDYEVDKVKCFEATCLSFGPIIFDLTEKSGYFEFSKVCMQTAANIGNDEKVVVKLRDSNRYLEWFKDVKNSQGSVETRSLKEAVEANTKGVYTVGNFHQNKFLYQEVTVEDVINLKIEEGTVNNDRSEGKSFSLEQINDLQSRLMLLGGSVDQTVKDDLTEDKSYFLNMSELVVRFAKVYVALVEVGSIRYFDWSRTIKCDLHKGEFMDSHFDNLAEEILQLESHLKEQEEAIMNFRENTPLLNHFTIKQCLMLQRFLYHATVDLRYVDELPAQVFTLLKGVAHDVDSVMVRNAVLQSYKSNKKNQDDSWKMADGVKRSNFTDKTYKQLQEMLERLTDKYNVAESIAFAVLHCYYPYDETKALIWCRKAARKEIKPDLVEEFAEIAEKEMENLRLNSEEEDEPKEEKMMDIDDLPVQFMPLEQLGCFLNSLSEISARQNSSKGTEEAIARRPDCLNNGKPSLLVLHQREILSALLYLYLSTERGLPEPKDVLLCNGDVTFELIQLIIRRAAHDPKGLYCIAFVDQLQYDINVRTFSFIEKVLKKVPVANLVFLCCKENEHKSFLVSALNNYKVSMPAYYTKESVVPLFHKHLKFRSFSSTTDVHHAGCADIEGFSARLVSSDRAGMGKSTFVDGSVATLRRALLQSKKYGPKCKEKDVGVTIPIQGSRVDLKTTVELLLQHEKKIEDAFPQIYHFDISPATSQDLSCFLFHVVVLGSLQTRTGKIWRKNAYDLCMIEKTLVNGIPEESTDMLDLLPRYTCMSPLDSYNYLVEVNKTKSQPDQLERGINKRYFKRDYFQRVCQYLKVHEAGASISRFVYKQQLVVTDHVDCLKILLKYCGVEDPSWMELRNFVHFFNTQLIGSEKSIYTSPMVSQDLRGFKAYVIKFLLLMSKDFSTRSLSNENDKGEGGGGGVMVHLKRRWEHTSHPYLFFNQDGVTMSFVGFNVKPTGEIINLSDSAQIDQELNMSAELYQDLMNQMSSKNGTDSDYDLTLATDYRNLSRKQKLIVLCRVLGVDVVFDPDETYELTMDNVTKIIAIYMRMKCGIPVILMGETGCGKTRLIRFMCNLLAGAAKPELVEISGTPITGASSSEAQDADKLDPFMSDDYAQLTSCSHPDLPDYQSISFSDDQSRPLEKVTEKHIQHNVQNMYLVKVHGGVTAEDLLDHIHSAQTKAKENLTKFGIPTILFLDEANTTPGIDVINEIMVDKRAQGHQLHPEQCGLHIIAACNPYRRHSKEMVDRLESAGLGYHIGAASVFEKIGNIPLRQLVYRVHQLPESMKTLVWDFGQLTAKAEAAYAKQIIGRYRRKEKLPMNDEFVNVLVNVLTASQMFMREQRNECSFVSLRDMERAVQVCSWFYFNLHNIMEFEKNEFNQIEDDNDKARRALVLSLGVCYIGRLESRDAFMKYIAGFFTGTFKVKAAQIKDEIASCQKLFLAELKEQNCLDENIALNNALCENVFMMVICIELRIPLFIVGKPGSSKSLAKTIVQDNMQGFLSRSKLFGRFKQINMSSFQCSPISTANGIIAVFKQGSRFQKDKNLDEYASVIVLDEVGLAEDSPSMPLKVLHPLLEDGTDGSDDLKLNLSEEEVAWKRCSFIGISNWALDPAKMNRGIMLCRGVPDINELRNTAKDICSGDASVQQKINPFLRYLAKCYLEVYENQRHSEVLIKHKKKEFFGLRDFYSLVKMVFCFSRKFRTIPPIEWIEHAVRRNFSGLKDLDTWKLFHDNLKSAGPMVSERMSTIDLIKSSFDKTCSCYEIRNSSGKRPHCTNNRYLLIMTEGYTALPLVEQLFLGSEDNVHVIFGSSFPHDQQFAQICRNINRIKMYMETGKTVVLLNMENLYESLYDALNQYYVYLGGKSYVDLGLGTHRVKCRVHDDFKLIVIADCDTVYRSFPIPLINRLEKHVLVTATCLTDEMKKIVDQLKDWVNDFSCVKSSRYTFAPADAFIGYNEDTCASLVMNTCNYLLPDPQQNVQDYHHKEVIETCKDGLLSLATPDALARVRKSEVKYEFESLWRTYFEEQEHSSLSLFLQKYIKVHNLGNVPPHQFFQVTTFSRLLSPVEKENLDIGFQAELVSLLEFQTEHAFREEVRMFLSRRGNQNSLLIIQCLFSPDSVKLVTCAQHICKEEKVALGGEKDHTYFLFLLQLSHLQGGYKGISCAQPGWKYVHIDDLRPATAEVPSLLQYAGQSFSNLFDFEDQVNREQYSGVTNLLRGCIASATVKLSMLKEMSSQHICNMIAILNKIFAYINAGYVEDDEGNLSHAFVKLTLKHMRKCFKQEEALSEDAANWIFNEAVEQRHSQDYGTFREALVHCATERVSSIFSSLLYEIDQNKNLTIFSDARYQKTWIGLYKTILRDIQLRKIVNAPREKETFQRKFPFSKQLMKSINGVIKAHAHNGPVSLAYILQLQKVMEMQPFTPLLQELDETQIKDYIHDLVYSVFTCENDSSYNVLVYALSTALKYFASELNKEKMKDADQEENPKDAQAEFGILLVHCTFIVYEERLQHLNDLLMFQLNAVQHAPSLTSNDGNEMLVDLQILKATLDLLNRKDDPTFARMSQGDWLTQVKELRVIVNNMLNHSKRTKTYHGGHFENLLTVCRTLWTRIQVIQMYLDNTTPVDRTDKEFHRKSVSQLIRHVEKIDDDMFSLESWTVVEVFLQEIITAKRKSGTLSDSSFSDMELQCLRFFLELVSEFIFSREDFDDMDEDLVSKIMGYAFHTGEGQDSKILSHRDQFINVTPWLRTYILQQFLKKANSIGIDIRKFLNERLASAESYEDMWDVVKLYIYCHEDATLTEWSLLKEDSFDHYVSLVGDSLNNSLNYLKNDVFAHIDAELLENIALARSSLASTASILAAKYLPEMQVMKHEVEQNLKKLVGVLNEFVLQMQNEEGHMFLLRQIIHQYGSADLKMIIKNSTYDFLQIKEAEGESVSGVLESSSSDSGINTSSSVAPEQSMEGRDAFHVYQDEYHTLKNSILQIALNKGKGKQNELNQLAEQIHASSQAQLCGILAILENVPAPEREEFVSVVFNNHKLKEVMDLSALIENDISDHVTARLLQHLLSVLHIYPDVTGLDLWRYLAFFPSRLIDIFFPAMPGDKFAEVRELNVQNPTNSFLFHQCPNGHPYVIENCGNAVVTKPCHECGATTGGANHQLEAGNSRLDLNNDTSEKGHCLGDVAGRDDGPERSLSPSSTALQRLLVNMSLLLATQVGNGQHVSEILKPRVEEGQVKEFLMAHLSQDVRLLGKHLGGICSDKAVIAVHLLIKHVSHIDLGNINVLDMLKSSNGRKAYEEQFHNLVLERYMEGVGDEISQSEAAIANGMAMAANPTLRKLYQLDPLLLPPTDGVKVSSCNQFWIFRQPITLSEFKFRVEVKATNRNKISCQAIWKFLQEDQLFTLTEKLLDLVQLQKILFSHFSYRIDKATASKKKIRDAVKELPAGDVQQTCKRLIESFIGLWKQLSPLLKRHARMRPEAQYHLNQIDKNTTLDYFLCSYRGAGRFSMAMLDLLAHTQNEFLEFCSHNLQYNKSRRVSLMKVKQSDLICYNAERDLLPVVAAFCDYVQENKNGCGDVSYNMEAIERHFIEKIYFGRAHLEFVVQEFVYQDDIHSSMKFKSLNEAIPQTKIPHHERKTMMTELHELREISNALQGVEIAIGFLSSTGGDPSTFYHKYICDVLHMNVDTFIRSKRMQTSLRLTHIASIWIMLQVEKARRLHTANTNPFFMEQCFRVELDDQLKGDLQNNLKHAECLDLLDLLTEYIVLELDEREESAADLPLLDALEVYEDRRVGYEKIDIGAISDEIQLMHIYSFWKIVVEFSSGILELLN